jgi:hypothetical protein
MLMPVIKQIVPGRLTRSPLVASIPTGRLNATIRRIRGTHEAVILLQHGLTGFLYHFSHALGYAVPVQWLFDLPPLAVEASEHIGDPERMERAARYLEDLIDAYVVNGDPYLLSEPQLTGSAFVSGSYLSAVMRQFVIAHEIMHLAVGDLDEPKASLPSEARKRELAADGLAATAVAMLQDATNDPPTPLATSLWGCTLALLAFKMLLDWVGFLTEGSRELQEDAAHPSPEQRAMAILESQRAALIRSGRAQEAQRLWSLTTSGVDLIQDLWYRTLPHLSRLRDGGVAPSPIWRTRGVPRSEAVVR